VPQTKHSITRNAHYTNVGSIMAPLSGYFWYQLHGMDVVEGLQSLYRTLTCHSESTWHGNATV